MTDDDIQNKIGLYKIHEFEGVVQDVMQMSLGVQRHFMEAMLNSFRVTIVDYEKTREIKVDEQHVGNGFMTIALNCVLDVLSVIESEVIDRNDMINHLESFIHGLRAAYAKEFSDRNMQGLYQNTGTVQ